MADRLSLHDQFLANALIYVTSRFGYDATFYAMVGEMRSVLPRCNWNSERMAPLIDTAQALIEASERPEGQIRNEALFTAIHDARRVVTSFSEWRLRKALDAIAAAQAKEGRAA
jgi:hypothetical protein